MKIHFKDALNNVKGVFTDEKQIHHNIEHIQRTFKHELQYKTTTSMYYPQHTNNNSKLLFIALVSFHHTKGAVVEMTFPSKDRILITSHSFFHELTPRLTTTTTPLSSNEAKLTFILNQLTFTCLPDGIHSTSVDDEMNIITTFTVPLYCVFAYKQLDFQKQQQAHKDCFQVNKRDCIQKSLCVISSEPLMFYYIEQAHTAMNKYMSQSNLNNKSIITELYTKLTSPLYKEVNVQHLCNFHMRFSYKTLLQFLHKDLFKLVKLLLLEKKIIVYSRVPYKVTHFMYCVLSLLPLQLQFNLSTVYQHVKHYRSALFQYGLPLKVFHDMNMFIPIFTLYDVDYLLSLKLKGYFIGTSNSVLLQNKRIERDVIVNVDECVVEFNEKYNDDDNNDSNNSFSKVLKITHKEREMYRGWKKMFGTKKKTRKLNDNVKWLSDEMHSNEIESNLKMSNDIKEYLMELLCDLSLGINECLNDKELNNNNSCKGVSHNNNNNVQSLSCSSSQSKSFNYFFTNIHQEYNIYFIKHWTQTINFKLWYNSHDKTIAFRSKYSSNIHKVNIIYEDGSSYEGGMQFGKRNGEGTLTLLNGRYYGRFVDGLYQGRGKLVDENGNEYNGTFRKGKKCGGGCIRYANGDAYDGEFKEDLFDGTGYYKYKKGGSIGGEFKNGLLNGKAVVVKVDDEGKIIKVFKGEFVNGVKHGKGEVLDEKGNVIEEEEWVDGEKIN